MREKVDENERVCFEIISNAGTAKSLVMEAFYAAKEKEYESADLKLKEANSYYVKAHKTHASLVQKEAEGDHVKLSLLLVHAESQLMSTETICQLVVEMIGMYKEFRK